MKKLNNKGVTLLELIVSFAIVAVAILYFYQTLTTVKTLYVTATNETKEFVIEDYGLRLADAYIEKNEAIKSNSMANNFYIGVGYNTYGNSTLIINSLDVSPQILLCDNGLLNCCQTYIDENASNYLTTTLYKYVTADYGNEIHYYQVLVCY